MADSNRRPAGSTPGPTPTAPASTTAPAEPHPDPTYYTWSNLFRIMLGQAGPDERQKYILAKDVVNEARDCSRCESFRDTLFESSPIIRFLRSEIAKIGPDLGPSSVHCRRCTTSQAGGFDLSHGILLCANELPTKSRIEDTLAHEMVHAHDWARWHVDTANMKHQACTEIRASALSGECRFTREFFGRAQYRVTGQFQDCVRRRATLSLMARPQINGDREKAETVVADVWDSCFPDTRPFDEIYR